MMVPLEEYSIPLSTPQQTTTEPEIPEVKQKPYGKAQAFTFLSTDQRCKEMTTSAQSAIDQLTTMPLSLTSAQDLYLHTLHSQNLLNKNFEFLTLSKEAYEQKKTTLTLSNNQFEAKLRNPSINTTPLNFTHVSPPKTAQEHLWENPLWAYQLEKAHQNMAVAQMGSTIVTAIEEGVGSWLKEIKSNIERQGQGLLNKRPLLRKRCEQIAELGKAICTYATENGKELLDKTPLPEWIQKAHALYVRGQNNHSLADELQRQFNIPRELGMRYEKDCEGLLPYFIPYATLGKLGMLPFTSIKRGPSSALTGIVKDIYHSVRANPDLSLYCMVGDATGDIAKALPSFDRNSLSNVGSWLKAIHGDQLNSTPSVQYFKEALDYRIAKLTDSTSSFIVKEGIYRGEIINEFIGFDFLHSLQLQHLQLPQVSAIGTRSEGRYAFIAKSYLPGDTMWTLFEHLGKSTLSSEKRTLLHKELCDASLSLGCATGELHNKGVFHRSTPPQHAISDAFTNLQERMADAETFLKMINKSLNLRTLERFGPAIEGFLRNPGPASFCFSDISGGQFVWNRAERKWGYIDAATVPLSFTPTGKPIASTPQEFYAFMHCFEAEGLTAGLLPSEVADLKKAFSLGYSAEYTGPTSAAANHFFDICSSIDSIVHIAEKLPDSTPLHNIELTIRRLLRDLDQKLAQGKS
jgi:hypothetical protein